VAASNVIGILEGSDPKLKAEASSSERTMIIWAVAAKASWRPRSGEIHHGGR